MKYEGQESEMVRIKHQRRETTEGGGEWVSQSLRENLELVRSKQKNVVMQS